MKVTMYMAITIDGYVAKTDGDSDWVSEVDSKNFEREITNKGCIFVGRKTFDQFIDDLYPVENVTNIIITTGVSTKPITDNVSYAQSPKEAINIAKEKGHKKALLIGGGITNGLFLKDNLIDEVILSVHPLALGHGIKLFEDIEKYAELVFVGQKELDEGLVQLYYEIKK